MPNASAPANGTTVSQLNSELSVNPLEAPGEPACTSGSSSAPHSRARAEQPGSFDTGALGSATAVNQQTTASTALGPIIGQIDYITGQANLAGYVVQVKANTPHETDTAAHYDVYFPLLLTGVAVCPNTAGVASTFRFNGQSLLSQLSGQPGDVRDLTDFPTEPRTAWRTSTSIRARTSKLNVNSTNCSTSYPAVNGYTCGWQLTGARAVDNRARRAPRAAQLGKWPARGWPVRLPACNLPRPER